MRLVSRGRRLSDTRVAAAPTLWVRQQDRVWRLGLRGAYWTLRLWWLLRRPSLDSAFVAVWRENELLLIRNSYRPGYTVPCGNLAAGETPREAARRELEEEVGICVPAELLEPACELVMAFESKQDRAYFFELRVEPSTPDAIAIDRREVVWAAFCEEERLAQLDLTPHVRSYLAQRRHLLLPER
jgi:ADP-ribose pyrophosphatase YjhB (NUDIX family)